MKVTQSLEGANASVGLRDAPEWGVMRLHVFAVVPLVLSFTAVAADTSTKSPRDAAWQAIDKSLRTGNLDCRRETVIAISTIDPSNQEAVNRLVNTMKNDKSVPIRQQAALALGQMKARQAIPALKDTLEDKSDEVAFAAATALTEMGDKAGQGTLIAVLTKERKAGPGMMTNARRGAEKQLQHPQGMLLMGAQGAAGAVIPGAGLGVAAVRRGAAGLRGNGGTGRASAAASLAKDPDPYAVTLLEWALGDDSPSVREEAAKGLGQRGNAASVAKLTPLLQDGKNSVRTMAAASIIRLTP
jgi:HEAT repeats